jgi:hypothetical protein
VETQAAARDDAVNAAAADLTAATTALADARAKLQSDKAELMDELRHAVK